MKRQPSIRRRLFLSIASLILLVTLAELGLTFFRARQVVDRLSRQVFDQTAAQIDAEMRHLFDPVAGQLELVRSWTAAGLFDSTEAADLNRIFIPILETYPQIAAVTAATEFGAEYLLIRMDDGWINRMTPPIDDGGTLPNAGDPSLIIRWDASGMNIVSQETRMVDYDSRTRPWWTGAIAAGESAKRNSALDAAIYWTEPYDFFTSEERGVSTSMAFDAPGLGRVVTALHLRIRDISAYMDSLRPTPNGKAALYAGSDEMAQRGDGIDERNSLLLSMTHEIGLPGLRISGSARRALSNTDLAPFRFSSGGETWWADFRPFDLTAERRYWTGIFIPERDLMTTTTQQVLLLIAMAFVALALAVMVAAQVSAQVSAPLKALVAQSGRIARMDLAPLPPVVTRYREMNQVSNAMEEMREALALQMQAREHTAEELRRSETKYRNLIETSNDIVWGVDREGRLTFLNQAVEQVFGQPPEAFLGQKFVEMGECRDRESDDIAMENVLAGESVRRHESERLLPDGAAYRSTDQRRAVSGRYRPGGRRDGHGSGHH